jgi:hypothetical protein
MENTGKIVDPQEDKAFEPIEPTEAEKELVSFIVDHTDRWREYRDQNYSDDWDRYDRIFRGRWEAQDKSRESERSRVISPATQQAVETRHAEVMEAIFGQGEYFDIADDISDANGNSIDVEKLKNQLKEDFDQDKIRKAIDQIELIAEITGTGIGEIVVGTEKFYYPSSMPIDNNQVAFGTKEEDRVFVRIVPVHPKNFLFDPNGTSVDDCMGVAVERYSSIHKIAAGMANGTYRKVEIGSFYEDDKLEVTQESRQFEDDKVKIMNYYGLVPKEYVTAIEQENEPVESLFPESVDDYTDMVEAIVVIANGNILLKCEESPYMMKDRPILSYQDDTVPNRLLGRGTVEKAFNMQIAIDAQMRSHLDSLALTTAPMMGMDATRLPRGAKFVVKPGGNFMVNGNPNEILFPFKFGTNDGMAMQTSKEFERMLLMATGTLDSQGMITQGSRDAGGLAPAVAGIIKKYKRTLVNFQEDFLIPFVKKAAWRRMQYDPERYPSVDVKFIPTATLGIIAREYEQQQLAFLIQTLGGDSKITPILMQGIIKNSSLSNREEILQQLAQASQPDPQAAQAAQMQQAAQAKIAEAQAYELEQKGNMHSATAQKFTVEAQLEPEKAKAEMMAAMTKNLPVDTPDAAQVEFDRRAKVAELMLKEEEISAKKKMVQMQMEDKKIKAEQMGKDTAYLSNLQESLTPKG